MSLPTEPARLRGWDGSSGWIFAGSGRFMLSADAVFANPCPVKARLRNFCSNALACSCASRKPPLGRSCGIDERFVGQQNQEENR
jgi:hypothetical protein